jgi:hypothetical protein
VDAAEAMPEEKYAFAPTSGEFRGVRTFAQMAKHVAVVNFMNAAALLEEKTPVEVGENENGADSIKTKAEILKFLKESFTRLLKATDTLDEKNLMTPTKDPGSGTQNTPPDVRDHGNISFLGNVRPDGHISSHEWN